MKQEKKTKFSKVTEADIIMVEYFGDNVKSMYSKEVYLKIIKTIFERDRKKKLGLLKEMFKEKNEKIIN